MAIMQAIGVGLKIASIGRSTLKTLGAPEWMRSGLADAVHWGYCKVTGKDYNHDNMDEWVSNADRVINAGNPISIPGAGDSKVLQTVQTATKYLDKNPMPDKGDIWTKLKHVFSFEAEGRAYSSIRNIFLSQTNKEKPVVPPDLAIDSLS